jgi:endonuclease V-like protein UPF0215 family
MQSADEHGRAAERVEQARKLGARCLEVYLAAHPGTSAAEAREILQKSNRYGRVPSAVAEG